MPLGWSRIQQRAPGRILPAVRIDRVCLVAAGTGSDYLCRLERSMVVVHGLAAAGYFPVHVPDHHGACQPATGFPDRTGGHAGRVGDRVLGNPDEPVVLLHGRAPSAVDHPGLADRQPVDRPDHKSIELGGKNMESEESPRDSKEKPSRTTISRLFRILYWFIFTGFFALMLYFVAPTFGKSFTVLSLLLVAFLSSHPPTIVMLY